MVSSPLLAFVVRYKYRFMDGLVARNLPCPRHACMGALTFYLPVNSFDLSVRRPEQGR